MDSSSSLVPTEDTIQALMNHLVDACLPVRSSTKNDSPSLSLQRSVANQMHAVVLLYNYYHRKQHPQLEFLDFESFCKVAVNANPSMLLFLKVMQKCNYQGLDGNLSVTEEAIMDACNISRGLDVLKGTPNIEGWPISKIAVFLTNSKMEYCFLHLSARIQGVWSLIEINDTGCGNESEIMFEAKKETEKRTDTINLVSLLDDSETHLQQLAVSAVKEATGIDPTELTILESHVAYSLSEENTTARLFIMKCKSGSEHVFQVPIKDAIDSLQGPLVKKSSNNCTVTNAVKYFQLLPYVGIIVDWFSRETLANGSVLLQKGDINKHASSTKNEPSTIVTIEKSHGCFGTSQNADYTDLMTNYSEILDQNESSDFCVSRIHNIDDVKSSNFSHPSEERTATSIFLVENGVRKFSTESELRSTRSGTTDKGDVTDPVRDVCTNENINAKVSGGNNICSTGFSSQDIVPIRNCHLDPFKSKSSEHMVDPARDVCNDESIHVNGTGVNNISSTGFSGPDIASKRDHRLVPFKSDARYLDKIQAILAKKGDKMSSAALGDLVKKRTELYHQQRQLEDEIAQCESDLQKILRGEEDDLMLKVETVTEACDAACSRDANGTHDETHFHCEGIHPLKCVKRKRLSEAILQLPNPCQELDEVCLENNWILPRYIVFPSNGGFRSSVTVHGIDFECSGGGTVRGNAREARESAASYVLSKLHSIVYQEAH